MNRDILTGIAVGIHYAIHCPELQNFDTTKYKLENIVPNANAAKRYNYRQNVLAICASLFEKALEADNFDDRCDIIRVAMVALDAEKYNLDIRAAAKDFCIPEMCDKYGLTRRLKL